MFPGVEDLYEAVGQALSGSAPKGFRKAWVIADVWDDVTDVEFNYAAADGSETWFDPDPQAVSTVVDALQEIRGAMIEAGQDEWTRCVFTVSADGSIELDIDYDYKADPTESF